MITDKTNDLSQTDFFLKFLSEKEFYIEEKFVFFLANKVCENLYATLTVWKQI